MSSFLKKLFNPRFLVKKLVRVSYDAYWDWKFGGWCGGTKDSPYAHLGANGTQSTEYLQLKILFQRERLPIAEDDVLIDVGCGKGRVINYWLMAGHRNRMVGIEIDDDIARLARQRLQNYPNVTILTGHAVELLPADGTKFYLWNTFGAEVMRRFKSRLMEACGQRGNVTLIYYNCEALHVFEGDPDWTIERLGGEQGLAFPSAIIRMRNPPTEKTAGIRQFP
jgi:SAM-dependent methyltransferase